MIAEKEWYRSKTIWGGLVALAAALAGLFGIEVVRRPAMPWPWR